jgi:hypothetical protein
MGKWAWRVAASVLLFAGTALAAPTAQQRCDYERISAWKKYLSCVNGLIAKDYKGTGVSLYVAPAKCRHKYFAKWTGFQTKASLAGSMCIGSRFTDNGDGTVTDNLGALVWEKKTNLNSTPNGSDPHDADNLFTWSTGAPYKENGTAFTAFLGTVNGSGGFAGANGWRLPTVAELQTVMLDFECKGDPFSSTCICPSSPCVDPALDATNTQASFYWSATSAVPYSSRAWGVDFLTWGVGNHLETEFYYVRTVRGGW